MLLCRLLQKIEIRLFQEHLSAIVSTRSLVQHKNKNNNERDDRECKR